MVLYFVLILSEKVFIYPLVLESKFSGYRILGWWVLFFSPQHFKYFIPLSSSLHGFWQKSIKILIPVVLLDNVLFFPKIILRLSFLVLGSEVEFGVVVWFYYFSFLMFSELPGSVVCLALILQSLNHYYCNVFFCLFFTFFSLWHSNYMPTTPLGMFYSS